MSSGIQIPREKFKHKAFRNKVVKRYDSKLTIDGKVVGWHDASQTKAAHIVPRALPSDEFSYLFGVGEEVVPTDPRNGVWILPTTLILTEFSHLF